MRSTISVMTLVAATAIVATGAIAAGAGPSGMPGDYPRPGDKGVKRPSKEIKPPLGAPAEAPPIALALEAAQAIIYGCSKDKIGVVVSNSAGEPILTYIPDGSDSHHVYTGIRKAYTAISFKEPTSALVKRAQEDVAFATKIQAEPNFIAYGGGVLLKVGGKIVGAIAVSGSDQDEDCALIGVHAIESKLK